MDASFKKARPLRVRFFQSLVMPGVVDRLATGERTRMFGYDMAILADYDAVGVDMVARDEVSFPLVLCPPSALMRQIRRIEEGSVSGSS
jgi:hypothetical protein